MNNKAIKNNKKLFGESLTGVRRKYLTDIFLGRIVVAWTIGAIIIVGFFGIRPLWSNISQKRATLKEMKEINKRLESNFLTLDKIGEDLLIAGGNLAYLYEYMPEEPSVHNYLVEFVNATSAVGYNLTRYSPFVSTSETEELGRVDITAKLKGMGDLVDLAKNIEDLKRVTRIKEIKYNELKTSKDMQVEVKVEIYFIKEL